MRSRKFVMALLPFLTATLLAQNTPPIFKTNNQESDSLSMAFQLALGDIATNIRPIKRGLLETECPTLFAGLDYVGPWTRDASINVFFGGGLLYPEVAKNTLICQLEEVDGIKRIGGQYWDSPLWIIAAWEYYLFTGDTDFLTLAYEAGRNQMEHLEATEYSSDMGLFRGASFFNDGIAGFPEPFDETGEYKGGHWISTITTWVEENPDKKHPVGVGLPMHCLSTNVIYAEAHRKLEAMAKVLEVTPKPVFKSSYNSLKASINTHFWNTEKGWYDYMLSPFGDSPVQETAGLAWAILYDIADEERAKQIINNVHYEPFGIPTIYPTFPRYKKKFPEEFARHSGTIWPQVSSLWVLALHKMGQAETVFDEISQLAFFANRDSQFYELFHPLTGQPYGGVQESNNGDWTNWAPAKRQTWAATGYINMVLRGLGSEQPLAG